MYRRCNYVFTLLLFQCKIRTVILKKHQCTFIKTVRLLRSQEYFTSQIKPYIERLREMNFYIREIAKFFRGLDSNKNGLVSKILDNSN